MLLEPSARSGFKQKTSTSRQVKSDVNVPEKKNYTPEEKVSIPRKNLVEGVPIFILCNQDGLTPSTIYHWKRDPQKFPLQHHDLYLSLTHNRQFPILLPVKTLRAFLSSKEKFF